MGSMMSRFAEAKPGELVGRVKNSAKTWVRRAKRRRSSKKRSLPKHTIALITSFILLSGTFAWALNYLAPKTSGDRISITQLSALADERRLDRTTFKDQDSHIQGRYLCATPEGVTPVPNVAAPSCSDGETDSVAYWATYPQSDSSTAMLLRMAVDSGAEVTVDPQVSKGQVRVVATIVLPLLLLANLFVLLFTAGKGASAGIGEVETFGSMGGGRFGRRKQATPITFSNIAGVNEAVEELKEVRDYLADPERYDEVGAHPPKGVLLVGPPGCGKTLLAKAVAGEVGVPFFSVAGAEFVESLVGVGAARVRDLFRRVRDAAPAILFIDEIDAAGRKRGSGGGVGGSDEREQTLNQILVEMDGFDVSSGIVVMGATNRVDILDPALLRPGRFDRHVTIDKPDLGGRTEILELHARNKQVSPEVDFTYVARRTAGFSGADLANVINEAALLAVRQDFKGIELPEIEEAIQRVKVGTTTRGRLLSPEERKRAAFHEAGHVVVSAATGRLEQMHRVSILAAGRKLGATSVTGRGDSAIATKSQLQSELVILLAGIASEELVFGECSTGGEKDLEQATQLARDIVARYGMSARLGRPRLLAKDVDEFLDVEVALSAISGQTQYELDQELRLMLNEAEREATTLITQHRQTLDLLAQRLVVEETLEGPDLESLLTMVRPEVELFGALVGSNGDGELI